MRIIARIVTVFALSLSLPKIIGIGPSIINPPIRLFSECCNIVKMIPENIKMKPINVTAAPNLRKSSDERI
jgi:hypothetical protein